MASAYTLCNGDGEGQPWSCLQVRNRRFIQKLTECEYTGPAIFLEVQHCPISRNNDVGAPRDSALENAIVGLVVENRQFFPGND